MKILILDDQTLFRQGLASLLAELPESEISQASTTEQGFAMLVRQSWDLLLLDINDPSRDIEALKRLKQAAQSVPVLVFSSFPEDALGLVALRAGAAGYIPKHADYVHLIEAIRHVLGGNHYLSPALVKKLASSLNEPKPQLPHETLSNREFQVMLMIGQGKSIKEIAFELSLSPKTVSTFRRRVMTKLHVKSNADVVRYTLHQKLQV